MHVIGTDIDVTTHIMEAMSTTILTSPTLSTLQSDDNSSGVGVIVAIVVLVVVVFIIITVVVVGIVVVWKRKKSKRQHTKQRHTVQENVYYIDKTVAVNRPQPTTAYNEINNGRNSNIFPSTQQVGNNRVNMEDNPLYFSLSEHQVEMQDNPTYI